MPAVLRARHYLMSHYRFRRNSVSGRIEYAPSASETACEGDAKPFIPLDKAHKHSLLLELAEAGVPNVALNMLDTVADNASAQPFDPVRDYLDRLPHWDGCERITALFGRFTDDAYELAILHRAFLATVGQMGGRLAYGNELCPILISRTQGWGKSKSLRRLLPPELQPFFTDTFNLKREEECLRRMNGFVLINLDEIDHYSPASIALLKKLVQMKDLNIRKLYCNWMETLVRRASFWGTSNCRYVLRDPSGSRRFFPVVLKGVVDIDSGRAIPCRMGPMASALPRRCTSWTRVCSSRGSRPRRMYASSSTTGISTPRWPWMPCLTAVSRWWITWIRVVPTIRPSGSASSRLRKPTTT